MLALIERLPTHLRLVVISRIDPPLRLARLRVRADLLEIRAAHLLFTEEEVAAFLTETMSLSLPAGAASILTARTEGWVAALQLAALSLRHQADPAAFLATFGGSHRHLLSYLVDEVLSQQSPELQAFLLATSVLDRLCAELCAAVIGELPGAPDASPLAGPPEAVRRAQALLEELNIANLFLIPLDTVSQWYCYHALFGEALRTAPPARSRRGASLPAAGEHLVCPGRVRRGSDPARPGRPGLGPGRPLDRAIRGRRASPGRLAHVGRLVGGGAAGLAARPPRTGDSGRRRG